MQDEWSTSSRDLLVALAPGRGRRVALEHELRAGITSGRLAAGTRLPSTRALARDLGVARGTVAEAYAQLVAEGYLVARAGSGTVVNAVPAPSVLAEGVPRTDAPPVVDFRPGSPDLSHFPRSRWLAATRQALHDAPDTAFGYGDPRGRIELREALASYLGRARGVRTSPELIVVCSGFSQALGLLCAALRSSSNTRVAMEDPCIPDHRAIVSRAGFEVLPAPVDGDGVTVGKLPADGVTAIVVTPAHQHPLGVMMRPARRAELLRWARAAGAYVIEDDYDGEFRYDHQPVGALQGLDPERVVYTGTASKTLAPGLRLAWMAVPPALLAPVMEAKRLADRHSPVLDQFTLANLLVGGGFDYHVRRMRAAYHKRRDLLVDQLARAVPALHPVGIAAGLHILLPLPPHGPSEERVMAGLIEHGIAVHPFARYHHDPCGRPGGIVIGYGTPPAHAYASSVATLVAELALMWPC